MTLNVWMIAALVSFAIALAELVFIWWMIWAYRKIKAEWMKEADKADKIILKYMRGEE